MAFAEIARLYERDKHFPLRTLRQNLLVKFRDGSFFDILGIPFNQETEESTANYIPLRRRMPAIHVSWANEVLQDVSSLLFGEGHFPEIESEDEGLAERLADAVEECDLSSVMSEVAFLSSVGSCVIFIRFLGEDGNLKPVVSAEDSTWFTPTFDPKSPWKLVSLTERYKVKGSALREMGFAIPDDNLQSDHWWKTVWDESAETGFIPVKVEVGDDGQPNDATVVDRTRTIRHDLGFTPAIWVRLPGGDSLDGRCLFAPAIDTIIEADYQLSQLGRGLKYSQDPLKVISLGSEIPDDFKKIVAGSDLLVLPQGSEAKLLETNGESARAVMEYVSLLRRYAVRAISGSPIDPERLTVPQSGRAMEILNMPLIQLADKLRSVFDRTLRDLIGMILSGSEKRPVFVRGKKLEAPENPDFRFRWPAWYPPTAMDRLQDVQAATAAVTGGTLSTESAVRFLSAPFDIDSPDDELKTLIKEKDDNARRAQQQRPDSADSQTA